MERGQETGGKAGSGQELFLETWLARGCPLLVGGL